MIPSYPMGPRDPSADDSATASSFESHIPTVASFGRANLTVVRHTNTSTAVVVAPVLTAGTLRVSAVVDGYGNAASSATYFQVRRHG